MTTTLIPLDPAMSAQRSTRILTISANLLPDEIIAARQARRTRGWVIVAVALTACLCAAWFAYALHQKQDADKELALAAAEVSDLQRDQREFSETVRVQADTALLTQQLTAVMANDLDWAALLATLRSTGTPSRIEIAGVNGALSAAGAAGSTETSNVLPSADAVTAIGSLTVTGEAPDKKAVAAYVDALGNQSVVANPFVTSVASTEGGGVTFSLRVDITPTALCGRFTVKCKTTGGN
jgi:hypothetical protein